ncbi:hypothetical protein [Calycomorphotria hydatis]|nr:hypothetical protein [Calycomorphotria hydatis]
MTASPIDSSESAPTDSPSSPTNDVVLDFLDDLRDGAEQLVAMPLSTRISLLSECAERLGEAGEQWVDLMCRLKRIPTDAPVAAEEILAGPVSTLRNIRLLLMTFRQIEKQGTPNPPGRVQKDADGHVRVPVVPIKRLLDRLAFKGLGAEVWMQPGTEESQIFSQHVEELKTPGTATPKVCLVLGAGNVASIPPTDTLHKIMCESTTVLLKLSPVNDALGPVLEEIFQPLIKRNLLRIIHGGPEAVADVINRELVDEIHITGSQQSHDAIVWGSTEEERQQRKAENNPRFSKSVTSELGNVSPWIVIPGEYTPKQLRAQAEHVASSITNNVSFNCIATKMIITSRHWAQRDEFLGLVKEILDSTPRRIAYYPGAKDRFEHFSRTTAPEGQELPWTLFTDAKLDERPELFREESFVCVCAETALDESAPEKFLPAAVDFANDMLVGTLGMSLTVPDQFQKQHADVLRQAISDLRYGSVCINSWSAIVYAMMSPPWGGAPGADIHDPQSGIGHVHNTFLLGPIEKTVLTAPLVITPKPTWFPTNKTAHKTAWNLFGIYKGQLSNVFGLITNALRG